MPTTYAHYRFGEEVRRNVSPRAAQTIDKYPELFHFGVHGPDLLFYFDALRKNSVNALGGQIHERPGAEFFQRAAETLRRIEEEPEGNASPGIGPDAYYSYLYGFLCHFTLDVFCHGYIQKKMDESGISHSEIEAELDRELLVMDGKDPVRQKLTGHLAPSAQSAEAVSRFFEGLNAAQIEKSMKDMVKYLDLLILPGRVKRGIVLLLLRIAKQYEDKHGLIINYRKNPDCADSTDELVRRCRSAVPAAAELIDSFPSVVRGEASMPEICQYNFSSVQPETGEVYGIK